jgi:hypothetical protein
MAITYARHQRILGRWPDVMLLATWGRFLRNSQKVYGVILLLLQPDTHFDLSFRNGDIVECRQDPIPKSAYQSHMEGSTLSDETPYDSGPRLIQDAGDIRYWSDFDRVYYLPRSLQKLPDPPEWKSTDLGWIQGHEMFTRHNEVDMNVGYQMECIDMDVIGCRTG